MNANFKKGDLLLYFNKELIQVVLLDEIDTEYFTIITKDDGIYQYGYKIRLRNLTTASFKKLDEGFLLTRGFWERYDDTSQLSLASFLDFKLALANFHNINSSETIYSDSPS